MNDPKRGRGRPPKLPAEKLERLVLFVLPAVTAKVEKHGKAWACRALEKARPPKTGE